MKAEEKAPKFNRQFILSKGIATELEYGTKVYETGMTFLSERFDSDERWMKEYGEDPKYWRWWQVEWDNHETALINHYRLNRTELTAEEWNSSMEELPHDGYIEAGFYNYLKLLRNVRIAKPKVGLSEIENQI